ncbi:MAG: 23S rRNA (uracil(1939)-C(5))-methyltransferase RlmD [Clostridium sp.]|nr:23S rRNA (uracil(1939)-C(5))-methyltransferase RlmD [Clostridium sp.]
MKKNDVFTVTIEDMGEDGAGIGKTDGYTWFIKDALIGDVIQASVMKMKKNYGFARLVKILEPAPGRVEARCPVARACGGCQLQELDYREQLRFKERKVYNHLKRIGGMDRLFLPEDREKAAGVPNAVVMEPIIGMEDPWRYRNKAQYPVGLGKDGQPAAGFYAGRTHSLIPAPGLDCLLGCQENKELLKIILDFMKEYKIPPYDEAAHQGLVRHVLLRKGFSSGGLMVCLVINGEELPHGRELAERLRAAGVSSVSYSVNMERTNVIMGTRIVNLYGPGYITDTIGDIEYRISPLSFYQVNPVQTEKLYGTALEFADLSGGETVWDLYCGIGTISAFLAKKAGKVYGVEIIPQAIEDARENARRNGIENVEFFVGKAEEVLPEQYERNHVRADVIVVDPPRKGCDPVCLETILKMAPERVVYVSCDSATLARDVKFLEENGYRATRVRPVDMFPMGGHVETVCLLSKKAQ